MCIACDHLYVAGETSLYRYEKKMRLFVWSGYFSWFMRGCAVIFDYGYVAFCVDNDQGLKHSAGVFLPGAIDKRGEAKI